MAEELKRRIGNERDAKKIIAILNRYLFSERKITFEEVAMKEGFISDLLETRRGTCMGISLFALALAERAELPFHAVALPQHMFLRYDDGRERHNWEPTSGGRELSDDDYLAGKFSKEIVPFPGEQKHWMYRLSKKEIVQYLLVSREMAGWERNLEDIEIAISLDRSRLFPRAARANIFLRMQDERAIDDIDLMLNNGFMIPHCMAIKGEIMFHGMGVRRDIVEARKLMEDAATRGSSLAQRWMGSLYFTGDGGEKDIQKSIDWMRKAAENGDVAAQWNLAMFYVRGDGVEKDFGQAEKWLSRSARGGNHESAHRLGVAYLKGEEVEKNIKKAVVWILRAARRGNHDAEHQIAHRYQSGEGVQVDHEEAVRWFRKAAESGEPCSQYHLGEYLLVGRGIATDVKEAYEWINKSAKQGFSHAEELLRQIRKSAD